MPEPPIRNPQPLDVQEALRQALYFHEQGMLEKAEGLYQAVLALRPDHFDALHLLGVLRAQQGSAQDAVRLISHALERQPHATEAQFNLGNAQVALYRYVEAVASYDKALALKPDHAIALNNRGNALQALDRHEEALASFDQALTINPDYADALSNRGSTLQALNRYEEALASYDKALAIRPDHVNALNNRGSTLQALNRHEEALASYDRALAIRPDHVNALNNRGNALQELKRYEEALASYDRALAIQPDFAGALNNRGNALQELKRCEEALASYDRALAIQPDFAGALNNRGNALQALCRHEEALASHDRALSIQPDYADALINRGNALQALSRHQEALASHDRALALTPDHHEALFNRGLVLRSLNRHEDAARSFARLLELAPDYGFAKGDLLYAKMWCCDWRTRDEDVGRLTTDIRSGRRCINPFAFLGVSESAQDQLLCSRIWVRDKHPASAAPVWNGERYRHERIRLAYLSADLHEHVMAYRLAGLFEMHDPARFETTALSFGPDVPSKTRTRLKGAFSRFVDVQRKDDREVADLLRELEIDIAVDLNGFTTDSRTGIFALRAAPVQVNYLGYPGTLGADYIDYILADRFVIPEQHQPCYTEKVVYLPDTYQVNDSRRVIADRTPARAEAGLPGQGFVFCSFNNNYKISPPVFDVWMRLLDKVAGSVLWLYASNAAAMRNLRKHAADRGIAPQRLVFAPKIRIEDYLARHRSADLALDTLPYNGHGTTSDALWAGLPVLTCLGKSFAGRVGASLLNAIGLNELITHSLEEYETLALELATNRKRLADIKSKLAKNRNTYPLFDTDCFRRHIEAAYTTMWERYQRGEPPASFAVEPHK